MASRIMLSTSSVKGPALQSGFRPSEAPNSGTRRRGLFERAFANDHQQDRQGEHNHPSRSEVETSQVMVLLVHEESFPAIRQRASLTIFDPTGGPLARKPFCRMTLFNLHRAARAYLWSPRLS